MKRPPRRNIFLAGLLAASVGFLGGAGGTASAAVNAPKRVVHFHGYRVTVPRAWPVFDLSANPSVCVRFDRHALYLGDPSPEARCPAHVVGRTEAILVRPRAGRVAVAATWRHHRATVKRALPGRSLSAAKAVSPQPASPRGPTPLAGPAPRSAIYTGLGFDTCAAPSEAAMAAWGSSAYGAVGIYIGGENRGCAQANLSSEWVSDQVAAGWHLIPIYVGLQASGACSCAAIDANKAGAQGAAAATAAVGQAQALGIPAGNPIYYDMEAYARGGARTSAVLAFLSAWTSRLHQLGYVSGVYSSAASGIADLVDSVGSGMVEPDDIWIANWNGKRTTDDPYVPDDLWANHQRIHQFEGGHNETHGGVTINIDSNYADGATADTNGATAPATAPANVTAKARNHAAAVSFTAPTFDVSNPITGYTVASAPGGLTANGLGSPISLAGLANGTSYTFTVTATYADGSTSTSSPSSPVTPHAPGAVCVVPRLKGLSVARARRDLHRSKCKLGLVKRPRHRVHHRVLRITRQHPDAGKRLAKRARVNVTVKWRRR